MRRFTTRLHRLIFSATQAARHDVFVDNVRQPNRCSLKDDAPAKSQISGVVVKTIVAVKISHQT